MKRIRLAFIPIGALGVALLSYGLGPFNGPAPSPAPADVTTVNPAAELAVPVDAVAVAPQADTDTDQKIAFWQERITANARSDVQYQYLGELFSLKARETGDASQYERARQAFETAIALYPGNASARSGLAVTLVALHEWQAAIDQATAILAADARAHGAVAVIGDASLEVGDLETARAAFETLRQVAGGPSVEARFARLAFLRGDTDGAIEILERAAASAAAINRPAEELAFYHYSIGEYRFGQGDFDGADRAFLASIAALPSYYLPIAGRGRVAYARGDLGAAIEAYERATAIIPRPELLAYLGDLHAVAGDQDAAEEHYAPVDFIADLGDAQASVANREVALFQATHQRDTAHAVRLAVAELEVRRDIYGYDALAWALFNDGQAEAARDPARHAVELGTRDARLLYHLGMIERAAGLVDEGNGHLREALALNPAFDPLGVPMAREALGG